MATNDTGGSIKRYVIARELMAAFRRWRNKYRRYKQQIPSQMRNRIILHYGLFKITWDWMILCLVFYTAVEVPFVSAFILTQVAQMNRVQKGANQKIFSRLEDLYPTLKPLLITDIVIDVLFMIDILINFRTTYVKDSETLVTCPVKIAKHYLKTYFVVDFVAAIPWELIVGQQAEENTMLFSLLKTARMMRLFRAARKLDRNYEYMTSLLFLMLLFFMLVSHWLACIWYALGDAEVHDDQLSWINLLAMQHELEVNASNPFSGPSIKSRYVTSLYYVMTLCTTVGFGNVAANTDAEKIFSICCMLAGAVMYAGIFGNVTAIIHGQYSSNFRYRKEVQQINEFINYMKIKNPLARRLREFSRHTWSQTKGTDIAKVMKHFPESLQYEIHLHTHFTVISDSFLFRSAEPGCRRGIAMRMLRQHHLPGHRIVFHGDEVESLYLVRRGKIDILVDNAVKGKIEEGDAFGAKLSQVNSRRCKAVVSLRATTCVDCHMIKLEDMEDVLSPYESTYAHVQRLMERSNQIACRYIDPSASPSAVFNMSRNNGNATTGDDRNKSQRTCTYERRHFTEFSRLMKCGHRNRSKKSYDGELDSLNNTTSFELKRTPSEKERGRFFNITIIGSVTQDGHEPEIQQESLHTDEQDNFKEMQDDEATGSLEFGDPCIVKHQAQTDLEERFRQVSSDVKRLESKVDTLLSVLERQIMSNNLKSDKPDVTRTTSV